MTRHPLLQAGIGVALCALGFLLSRPAGYEVHTVLASAAGCRMPVDIYEPRSGTSVGSVVLFHGLAANKTVMAFTAEQFANQDLRVFVPDFPGHGKAPGPFSPGHAEACAESLVSELIARRAIVPQRTLLAGHSMGAAIAARVASRVPVAGVIAISPAPMHPAKGVPAEALLFPEPPQLPGHSLVLSAAWEPRAIRDIAADLVTASADTTNRYLVIPNVTHVSILFSAKALAAMRDWTSAILGASSSAPLPTTHPALGCMLGLAGLCLLAPPFLRELTAGKNPAGVVTEAFGLRFSLFTVLTVALAGALAVVVLKFFVPLRFLHLFQGDYFASFLLLAGTPLLLLNFSALPRFTSFFTKSVAGPAFGALLLVLLFAAWYEVSFYEAWFTASRWLRFPAVFLALLPWHLAEEILLGPAEHSLSLARVAKANLLRALLWLALLAGILVLHSGQILLVLFLVYFVLFSLLQRVAIDLIRHTTRSPAAAAIFGAILLAGFALAVFPIA